MNPSLPLPALGISLPYEAPVREDIATDRSTMWCASARTRERDRVEVRAHVHTMRKTVYAITIFVSGDRRESVRIRKTGSSWAEVDAAAAREAALLGLVDHLGHVA